MKYEYLKGSEKDFEGFAANILTVYRVIGHIDSHGSLLPSIYDGAPTYRTHNTEIIAERRPITDEQEKTLEKTRELLSDLLIPNNPNFEDAPTYRGEPITNESDLNECIGQQESHPPIKFPCESHVDYHFRVVNWAEEKAKPEAATEEFIDDFVTFGKYDRQCKGVVIDVYDVLQAFEVVNPALQHLIKKALCAGLRGHKKREQDLVEILESAKRAIELEGK